MSVRDELVTELSKELMGPRRGWNETIITDPKYEYIAGIIEPKDYWRSGYEDLTKRTNSDVMEPTNPDKSEIIDGHVFEDESDPDMENTTPFHTIDPRAFPKSMGMAFVLDQKVDKIDICATWARYKLTEEVWKRVPNFMVLQSYAIDCNKVDNPTKDHVEIEVQTYKIPDSSTKFVSVRLINNSPVSPGVLKTEYLLFQPQIRIHLKSESMLKPLPEYNSVRKPNDQADEPSKEEQNSALLYRDRSAYGRGFQCGVIWKKIDPESNSTKYKKYDSPPYGWTDAAVVDQRYRKYYLESDIRTEFFPIYSVTSADSNERLTGFSATTLSENFSSKFYQSNFLRQIIKEYSDWIEGKKNEIDPRNKATSSILTANLTECITSNNRIKDGIQLLVKDERARLAFCFMNKVMDMQSNWTRGEPLIWRPFQISFILMCLESIVNRSSDVRDNFDLLWYPTGGGKTEAYLGLAMFTMAFRRLDGEDVFDGVSIISRYTLRLLTIQQFRRALKMVTAAEILRIKNWHPDRAPREHLWGLSRFSVGLWVGRHVTPNHMITHKYTDENKRPRESYGAIKYLKDPLCQQISGDPAQILNCPLCNTILALPLSEISKTVSLLWVIKTNLQITGWSKIYKNCSARLVRIGTKNDPYHHVQIDITPTKSITIHDVLTASHDFEEKFNAKLVCSNAALPGYFLKNATVYGKPYDFEIRCPNDECELNKHEWQDFIPSKDGHERNDIITPFQKDDPKISYGIPIPAYTVDEQIYHRCPSMIVATVDKIARLAFESRGASLFGNIDEFDADFGYYRNGKGNEPDTGDAKITRSFPISPFRPPDLIIQDELHLIDGPLGTMVGIYEMAVDLLSSSFGSSKTIRAKYIGSTATVRAAWSQISSVYERKFVQFPPHGIYASDNFFSKLQERPTRDDIKPGRLYMGVCTPGTSAQTTLNVIWSTLLQTPKDIQDKGNQTVDKLDPFLTVVGYFNSIRELSSAVGRYRQDVPERIKRRSGSAERNLGFPIELSSRIKSEDLPHILDSLAKGSDDAIPGVFATSMFGTGVDIDRLGLMIVHGQPKTTSSYIQSTGRVGRTAGGLVIVHLNPMKPRDLNHYEFFTRYHRAIQRYVEPITVTPFSLRCIERTAGPLSALILRNSRKIGDVNIDPGWRVEPRTGKHGTKNPPSGSRMMKDRNRYREVQEIIECFERRCMSQPRNRQLAPGKCRRLVSSEISKWTSSAREHDDLLYWESTFLFEPKRGVVLGAGSHDEKNMSIYESSPQSLRNVESTTRFYG